jgi:hypothetical protein
VLRRHANTPINVYRRRQSAHNWRHLDGFGASAEYA